MSINIRVVPDIRLAGYPAFLNIQYPPDIRFHLPDIQLEKLFEIYHYNIESSFNGELGIVEISDNLLTFMKIIYKIRAVNHID